MYGTGCCDSHSEIRHSKPEIIRLSDDGSAYIDQLIKQVFADGGAPDVAPTLVRAYAQKLEEAITEGYGKLDDFNWDTPDYQTIVKLQNNVWQFSAAKNYTELRDLSKALVGPDGKPRSFDDFKRQARLISDEYMRWLQTEYDTALAGAQMAAKWMEIQKNKHLFPILEFDAVMDERTSKICRPLNKVRKAIDDPFWKLYYPPNHFNCRSTVRQLREGEETPDDEITYPENVPDMFKVNLGERGLAFPPDHPYYIDTPGYVKANATLYMPEEDQYIIKYQDEEGRQLLSNRKTDIEQGSDYDDLLKAGKVLTGLDKAVRILPIIQKDETDLRDELLPGVKGNKNPDLEVDDEYTELKTASDPVSYSKLQTLIAGAAKQADRVIVLLDGPYSEAEMKGAAMNRFKAFPDLEEIGFVTVDGEYIEYFNHKGQ